MKLFVSKKKYDVISKEYLKLSDDYEELREKYKNSIEISKNNFLRATELETENEKLLLNEASFSNEIITLNQEIKLYEKTVKELEKEIDNLKNAYEEKYDRVLDLEYKSEMSYFERVDLENEIFSLKEEIEKLKKANEELAKLWNDANRKLWCNNESARQLRKISEDMLNSQRIDKNYLASYIYDISLYVGGGVGVELKSKDK